MPAFVMGIFTPLMCVQNECKKEFTKFKIIRFGFTFTSKTMYDCR